ncbi:MAG: transposase [Anaerolineae bacterium]|nr:transposase [Anaerolineae bacterium]
MIDFPITELLSDEECVGWLEQQLHPQGFVCPHCGRAERRLFRAQGYFPAYRCRACDGYYTRLSGTVFEKTRQRPATLVLLLRGIAKGESSARLARELGMGRKRVLQRRQRIQNNLYETLPTQRLDGQTFEADELYQNAGEKRHAASAPPRPTALSSEQATGTRHVCHGPSAYHFGHLP